MITDIVDDGDGDVLNGGKPPRLTQPGTVLPLAPAAMRRARLIRHAQQAMALGLSLADALAGTGVSATTVRRWLRNGEGDGS